MARNEYKQQDSVQHKCPNCGAPLKYNPTSGTLKCEHCNSSIVFEKDCFVVERDFEDMVTFKLWKDSDVASYRCSNCGAVSVASRTTLSTECPYCGSPVVIEDKTGSVVKPDTVIPFELSAKDATERLSQWRRKKAFAPRTFKRVTKENCIKGVYIPMWTFDAQTATRYNGTLGKHRTRTVKINGKSVTETYTEWFRVSGVYDMSFDDILVRANDNISESDFRALQPFPQSRYMVFDDEYFAGYMADHYSLEPQEAFKQAKARMLENIRQAIIRHYNADVEGPMTLDLDILSKSFKYVFVPVYVATTKYKKQTYNQYVSGIYADRKRNTIKVSGKAPVSSLKIFLLVLLILAFVATAAILIIKFGSSSESEVEFDWSYNFDQTVQSGVPRPDPNCTQYNYLSI